MFQTKSRDGVYACPDGNHYINHDQLSLLDHNDGHLTVISRNKFRRLDSSVWVGANTQIFQMGSRGETIYLYGDVQVHTY